MKNRFAIAVAAFWLCAVGAFAQISVDDNRWDWGTIRGVPTTFTNAQAVTLSTTDSGTRIRMNPSQLAPVTFKLNSVASGTNGNTANEGRFTVVFGNSMDGKNIVTNGTWVSTFNTATATANRRFTNWVHGAVWPFLHVISVTVVSNTASGVRLEYSQPNGQ